MQKSCKYCYQSHEEGFNCPKKHIEKSKTTKSVKFRSTNKWQRKREKIKERDSYLCQICIRNLYNTLRVYNYKNLQVHHAIPIAERPDLELDNENLITLCSYHHMLAEKGEILYVKIRQIIREQEMN